jgi:hypothetical protein
LDDAGPGSDDHVHGAEEQQGPYGGEAPDVAGIVEVLGHGDVGRHRPVERWEVGDLVVGRGGAADALDEAGGISKRRRAKVEIEGMVYLISSREHFHPPRRMRRRK